jgi:hypothetical protein
LNSSHYGILLGGKPANEENGVEEIPPIFALAFSKVDPGRLAAPVTQNVHRCTIILFVWR